MAAQSEVNRYHPFSLIDRDGNFNENIGKDLDLAHENCVAVSIIGVQSSGKSTLLNKCFSTKFKEMDDTQGMSQTTKGIWIAKGPSLNDGTKILLIDTEGSDGSERGREGNDSFERKNAAFILAMSNTVIINMKCENVGLHNGGSWPLLKIIFQVMLHKFTSTPPKVNLMFVLRDKNQSPPSKLEEQLTKRLDEIWQEIWREISRSEPNRKAELKDYFNVVVKSMPHYVYQREEFDTEVNCVREQLFSLVKDGQTCPASEFLDDAKGKWDDITKNKILTLNLNKAADVLYCHNIMKEKSENFLEDKDWDETKTAVESGTMVQAFGERVNSIMDNYLSQYDKGTLFLDERTRNDSRDELQNNLSTVVEPCYLVLVAKMRQETLEEFLKEIGREIQRGGKFENINSDRFFHEFRDVRLTDAHVQLATWNHTSSQLDEMQSKLDSYKEAARTVMDQLAILKECKEKLLRAFMDGLVGAVALVAAFGAALGFGVACPLPNISFESINQCPQTLIKWVKTKKRIGRECQERPECDKIMNQRDIDKNRQGGLGMWGCFGCGNWSCFGT